MNTGKTTDLPGQAGEKKGAARLRFDTNDKKPKLYDLIIPAVVYAAAVLLLALTAAKERPYIVSVLSVAFCLLVLVRLVTAYIGQIRYNPYSYNTIYYFGFSLFTLSVLITHVILLVRQLKEPAVYDASQSLYLLMRSAKDYMLLTAPVILFFAASLCVSNFSLIRHEGRRLVNVLGIILSFLLVAGEAFLFAYDYYASGSMMEVLLHDLFANAFAAVYLYFECMLIGAIAAGALTARYEPDYDKDYMIILGCGLRKDGSPTPLLRGRIDRAIEFYRKQKEETGRELVFITSGGQGPNEVISESASMKRYLMEQGIPEERIIEEDRSRSTFENMKFSREKILETGRDGKTAFSTTNYHVFRSGLFARRADMRAQGVGAKTKWYFWPNAAVREFVGILTEHKGKQAIILGCFIVFYLVGTVFLYMWA